jgi:2,5-diketo-D-gluconate reductase A
MPRPYGRQAALLTSSCVYGCWGVFQDVVRDALLHHAAHLHHHCAIHERGYSRSTELPDSPPSADRTQRASGPPPKNSTPLQWSRRKRGSLDSTALAPTVTLSNGVQMPALGLGTWPMNDREAERTIARAIETGYRLFDTAENYENERGVGLGIKAAGVPRDQVFITTKFNRRWHGYDEAQQAFANSAARLGVDYIDLLLIHWPNPAHDRYVDAWRGMCKLLEDGKVRAIGGSNFKPAHIDRMIKATGVTPHVNQVQLNPWIPRATEQAYHREHGIATEAWAPIAKGSDLLSEAPIQAAASAHRRTPAQVVLRWHLQQGVIPIPKTSNPDRLAANLSVFDFDLSPVEMNAIAGLTRNGRGAVDSDATGH